jgi:hypothetical protein
MQDIWVGKYEGEIAFVGPWRSYSDNIKQELTEVE